MQGSTKEERRHLVSVGEGFWNVRGSFKILIGLIDIGTHMSVLRLPSDKYLIVDTIPLTEEMKKELDDLTQNGSLIEAVIATHPFHTLAFKGFYEAYPDVPYYGTPRHLRNLKDIPWAGDLNDCDIRNKWAPDVQMRIPAGAEFVAPVPEKTNHFNSVWVLHTASGTIHVDDTVMYSTNPGLLLKLAGYKHGTMSFHPSMKGPGLLPTPEAPFQFRDWVNDLLENWEFDNICTAHLGNKIGGAKEQLRQTLAAAEDSFKKISKRNERKGTYDESKIPSHNVVANECG